MGAHPAYPYGTDEFALRNDGQTAFDRQSARQAEITDPALGDMLFPDLGGATKGYGSLRLLNGDVDTTELGIVETQQVQEMASIIHYHNDDGPTVAFRFRFRCGCDDFRILQSEAGSIFHKKTL